MMVDSSDVFRKLGQVHIVDSVNDDIVVIPPRQRDETDAEWAQGMIRITGVGLIDLPDVLSDLWKAMGQFLSELSNAMKEMWTIIQLFHDCEEEVFHHLVAQHLGREVECPVCEARDNAAQARSTNPHGEGSGEAGTEAGGGNAGGGNEVSVSEAHHHRDVPPPGSGEDRPGTLQPGDVPDAAGSA